MALPGVVGITALAASLYNTNPNLAAHVYGLGQVANFVAWNSNWPLVQRVENSCHASWLLGKQNPLYCSRKTVEEPAIVEELFVEPSVSSTSDAVSSVFHSIVSKVKSAVPKGTDIFATSCGFTEGPTSCASKAAASASTTTVVSTTRFATAKSLISNGTATLTEAVRTCRSTEEPISCVFNDVASKTTALVVSSAKENTISVMDALEWLWDSCNALRNTYTGPNTFLGALNSAVSERTPSGKSFNWVLHGSLIVPLIMLLLVVVCPMIQQIQRRRIRWTSHLALAALSLSLSFTMVYLDESLDFLFRDLGLVVVGIAFSILRNPAWKIQTRHFILYLVTLSALPFSLLARAGKQLRWAWQNGQSLATLQHGMNQVTGAIAQAFRNGIQLIGRLANGAKQYAQNAFARIKWFCSFCWAPTQQAWTRSVNFLAGIWHHIKNPKQLFATHYTKVRKWIKDIVVNWVIPTLWAFFLVFLTFAPWDTWRGLGWLWRTLNLTSPGLRWLWHTLTTAFPALVPTSTLICGMQARDGRRIIIFGSLPFLIAACRFCYTSPLLYGDMGSMHYVLSGVMNFAVVLLWWWFRPAWVAEGVDFYMGYLPNPGAGFAWVRAKFSYGKTDTKVKSAEVENEGAAAENENAAAQNETTTTDDESATEDFQEAQEEQEEKQERRAEHRKQLERMRTNKESKILRRSQNVDPLQILSPGFPSSEFKSGHATDTPESLDGEDTSSQDNGSHDSSSQENGSQDSSSQDSGSQDNSSQDNNSQDNNSQDNNSQDNNSQTDESGSGDGLPTKLASIQPKPPRRGWRNRRG